MINATWHKKHPMPPRATPRQRLRWHLAHAKVCSCRKLSAATLKELQRRAAVRVATKGGRTVIRKLPSEGYRLYSRKKDPKTGRRRNLGIFRTRVAAQKHERAIQFFKRRAYCANQELR